MIKKIRYSIFFTFILTTILILPEILYAGRIVDKSPEGYLLFIPKSTLSDRKFPVLICLPGLGVSSKQDIGLWVYPAEKKGIVVINLQVDYDSIKFNEDLESFYRKIHEIVLSVSKICPIDIDRLYIAGTSAGGMLSIALTLKHPLSFIAIGVISGARLIAEAKDDLSKAKGCNFYIVHGSKDSKISINECYETKKLLENNGARITFKTFQEYGHTLPSLAYKEFIDWLSNQ